MTRKELAAAILQERSEMFAKSARRERNPLPYYLLNLSHPAMHLLYQNWRLEKKGQARFPPSDLERTEFELEMLSASALKTLEQHFNQKAQKKSPSRLAP
ncbi:hypothetical protein [Pygmaiobacter massiliensis]|uniref:hypothetical protein n=1 Tax=Pygmaiobacter massiliensis TaxID=1917873 RepID=UPI000C7AB99A|nr:hypothetical protein [Pygmaiobacter massiliensis]